MHSFALLFAFLSIAHFAAANVKTAMKVAKLAKKHSKKANQLAKLAESSGITESKQKHSRSSSKVSYRSQESVTETEVSCKPKTSTNINYQQTLKESGVLVIYLEDIENIESCPQDLSADYSRYRSVELFGKIENAMPFWKTFSEGFQKLELKDMKTRTRFVVHLEEPFVLKGEGYVYSLKDFTYPNKKVYFETLAENLVAYKAPIVYATEKKDEEMVRALLVAGHTADEKDKYATGASLVGEDGESAEKDTALIKAIKEYEDPSMPGIVKLLLEHNAKKKPFSNGVNIPGIRQKTALHWATKIGDASLVKLLLNSGANPDLRDFKGRTALSYATSSGNVEVVQELLNRNANPTIGRGLSRAHRLLRFSPEKTGGLKVSRIEELPPAPKKVKRKGKKKGKKSKKNY